MSPPRCFIIRHGETEWSLNGRHTGVSDIPLTANGESRVRATGRALVGDDRLIVPGQLAHIYVSPRHRAQRTVELLGLGCHDPYPWQSSDPAKSHDASEAPPEQQRNKTDARVEVTEAVREWDYGEYEGITSTEIRERRRKQGLNEKWDIWTDGCPGGESPAQVTERLDALISEIRQKYHIPFLEAQKSSASSSKPSLPGDVLVVAHGHILRAFAMRWIGHPLQDTRLLMEAGGVGTCSYEHNNIEEPAILLGGGFVVTDSNKVKGA